MSASKLLISGAASSGKTTVISKLNKALVIVTDNKSFPFKVSHYRYTKFNGLDDFRNVLIEKLKAYKAKYDEKPETVVIDSVTHLYQEMHVWAKHNFKGFDIFNEMQTAVIELNDLIETLLIANGVNVVITAHTTYNEGSGSFEIPAMGKFKETGGWLSLVDNATHISTEHNRRVIFNKSLKYPARSTIDIPDKQNVDDYNIVDHMKLLTEAREDSDDYSI